MLGSMLLVTLRLALFPGPTPQLSLHCAFGFVFKHSGKKVRKYSLHGNEGATN